MSPAPGDWKVLEHGPLQVLADNLWWVDGSVPRMSLRRNMTVARMDDGGLIIHNAIALDDEGMARLLAFGEPSYLVVPNAFHRIDAAAYKKRFPSLRVFAPRGARAKVSQVVPVDGTYQDFPTDSSVSLEALPGVNDAEGAMKVRSADGVTLVLNVDRKRDLLGFLITSAMGSAPGPRISRLAKWALVKDKAALRAHLEQLADTPRLVRLVVAHEKVARGPDAALALRQAATYL